MLANLAQKTRLAVNKGYLFALGVEHGLAELVHINAVRLLVVVCVLVVVSERVILHDECRLRQIILRNHAVVNVMLFLH